MMAFDIILDRDAFFTKGAHFVIMCDEGIKGKGSRTPTVQRVKQHAIAVLSPLTVAPPRLRVDALH